MPTLWADIMNLSGFFSEEVTKGVAAAELRLPGLMGCCPELPSNALRMLEGIEDEDSNPENIQEALSVLMWEPPKE
jgi:hypothetical protein